MPHQSVSHKTAAYHYTIQKPTVKNTANKSSTTLTKLNSFSLPLDFTPVDPYDACVITPENCINDMAGYTIPLDSIRKSDTLTYAKQGVSPIPNYHDVKYKDEILDPIDADYYYGDTTIDYQSSIIGLWSMWGGFPVPRIASINGIPMAMVFALLKQIMMDAEIMTIVSKK